MLKTTAMLNQELNHFSNPGAAINRLVREKKLTNVRHGLYETDAQTPGICLAMQIYGPSYLSFDFALAYYDLIPEAVTRFTSATFRKHKSKEYTTPFGIYSYRDVPDRAYPWGLVLNTQNTYPYLIASPEKAICDKLYTISPLHNRKEMTTLLFDDLRIDPTLFRKLNRQKIMELASLYQTTNHRILISCLKGNNNA
ncbi:MAG: hypothetical protein IJI14_04135 [Anaerolineaceae bacterium]|nr:hypothetical protein [Anaerolineaceae bacterium]